MAGREGELGRGAGGLLGGSWGGGAGSRYPGRGRGLLRVGMRWFVTGTGGVVGVQGPGREV